MKRLVFALLLLVAVPLAAQPDPRIAEGVALHEAGKYDEAIDKYKAVLADSPGDKLATYELAFAYQMKGDAAKCREAIEPIANERDPDLQPMILTVYGNCLDMLGDSKKAIATYRKGLKAAPNEPQLLYNLAIALIGQNQVAEARELLKKELILRPGHASGHYALGRVFESQGLRAAALLEYLRMLALDSRSRNSADAAKRVDSLLTLGVELKQEGGANITINPNPPTEEGDFKGWEMMLGLLAAGRVTKDGETFSEFDKVRSHLSLALRMLLEKPPAGRTYTIRQNIPFFQEMEKQKLLEVFTGLAVAPLGLAGAEEWAKQNEEGIRQYVRWAQGLPR